MTIDWFPGHMATARREAGETMQKTDVVIEVLDARVPHASKSPLVEDLRRMNQRPAFKILNKADVADAKETAAWLAFYNAQPQTRAVALSATNKSEVARIPKECLTMAPTRGTRLKPLRMMILGIPNVGKSTLMNTLLRRHVANVGDEPAVTKMQMRLELGPGMFIVDTPGMLWPHVDQDVAHKLAATHSIGRNAYEDENVALFLANLLLQRNYGPALARRYGPLGNEVVDGDSVLAHIARSRNIVVDVQGKSALTLLQDFRAGLLGRITLESAAESP